MIGRKNIVLLLFFLLSGLPTFSNPDSLFLEDLKHFFYKETGFELSGSFYTRWSDTDLPYYCLFVSKPDTVEVAPNFRAKGQYPFMYCDNEIQANWKKGNWEFQAYHGFVYKTYANASCLINKRFLSYSKETKSFIVFHELTHNYVIQNKLELPYDIHEALCDVVGNYLALKFSATTLKTAFFSARQQVQFNEKIYGTFNDAILKINRTNVLNARLLDSCRKEVQSMMQQADDFQKDRFNYPVNMAYLLKNSSYCRHYFLLKRVFQKQQSILKLLAIIKTNCGEKHDWISYLEANAVDN